MNDRPLNLMPLWLALLPVVALLGAVGLGVATVGASGDFLLLAMLFAALVAGLAAMSRGAGWDAIQAETGKLVAEALPVILILLSIGALIGSWMFAGTIPLMVVLGIDLVNPHYMALTAFVATSAMSLVSGTSWGSAGTIGVALMGAAEAMGIPLAPVAGAVVSGAYLGDKLSPLSDMTNIAAIGAGAELYAHIRHMLWTSIPPAAIALAVYTLAGVLGQTGVGNGLGEALATRDELRQMFALGPLPALPLLIAVAGIFMRFPPALVILASAVSALAIGVGWQGHDFAEAIAAFVGGFDTTTITIEPLDERIGNLLNRGGLVSMAPTLLMVFAAFLLAAAMRVSGALDRLLEAMLARVESAFGLVAATMAAGATMVGVTSHGGVTSLVVGGLFRPAFADQGLAPENLSRALEDSVTVTEPLMPWTVSGLFMATTLGIATLDLAPWALFCWLCPIASLALAALYARTGRGLKPLMPVTAD